MYIYVYICVYIYLYMPGKMAAVREGRAGKAKLTRVLDCKTLISSAINSCHDTLAHTHTHTHTHT